MCGRFTLHSPADAVAETFYLPAQAELAPRWNIAPTQPIAIVRNSRGGLNRELTQARWGMGERRTINARRETVAMRPSFRMAFQFRRCLVVADGFYEWSRGGTRKQPYYFRRRDGYPFGMAGIWEAEDDGDCCAILTMEASPLVRPIHERMPVIIRQRDFAAWLDPDGKSTEGALALGDALESETWIAFPVGARVNDARVDDQALIEPIS